MFKKISSYFLFCLFFISSEAKDYPGSFADLAENLMPSVVNISTTQVVTTRTNPFPFEFPPGSPFEDMFRDFGEQQQRRTSAPGESGVIDVKFNSKGKKGKQNKHVTLTTNMVPSQQVLIVKGQVNVKEE